MRSSFRRTREPAYGRTEKAGGRIQQGNLVLYATSLQVRHLRQSNFYRIDTLDLDEGTGYQRILNEARAKRLADYLLDGHKALEAFLPTSIFLATDKLLPFDLETNSVRIEFGENRTIQRCRRSASHPRPRTGGREDPLLDEFEIPVNIAVNLDATSQMAHFLIVNTTQRSVDKAIEQQIVARLTNLIDFAKTPVLPEWIQRQVDEGEDARALQIVQHLNDERTPRGTARYGWRMTRTALVTQRSIRRAS